MKDLSVIIVLIMCGMMLGCRNNTTLVDKAPSEALKFFNHKHYTYSLSKKAIPEKASFAIERLNSGYYSNSAFEVGDTGDMKHMTLSDVHMPNDIYFRRLNYVLVNDTFCLVSYTNGGIGTNNTIDFVQYSGDTKVVRFADVPENLDSTTLERILLKYQKPTVTLTIPNGG